MRLGSTSSTMVPCSKVDIQKFWFQSIFTYEAEINKGVDKCEINHIEVTPSVGTEDYPQRPNSEKAFGEKSFEDC